MHPQCAMGTIFAFLIYFLLLIKKHILLSEFKTGGEHKRISLKLAKNAKRSSSRHLILLLQGANLCRKNIFIQAREKLFNQIVFG